MRRARRWLKDANSAVQRARQGWSEDSVWCLEYTLCKTLGEQLLHLAREGQTVPNEAGFAEFYADREDWAATLGAVGFALLRYANFSSGDCEEGYEYDNILDESASYYERVEEAQEALRWVADHLTLLWD